MLFWLLLISMVTASDVPISLYSNDSSVFNTISKPETEDDEVHFLLYSRNNKNQRQEINLNDIESLNRTNYNFNVSSKIIIHGWISSNTTIDGIETLKDAFVNKSHYNIIVVDWNKFASGQYKTSHKFSSNVATLLIKFIKLLLTNGVSLNQLHIIGHCIGAHIAGIAGKYFRDQDKMIDAITGLDPAYPNYKFTEEDDRLDKEDARLVEVIHTNTGLWGYRSTLGHLDFFPNGGRYHPGCLHDARELCAHDRALWFYAYSIIGTKFIGIAVEFEDRIRYIEKKKMSMGGLKLKYGRKGSYWLRTGEQPPFVFNPDGDVPK